MWDLVGECILKLKWENWERKEKNNMKERERKEWENWREKVKEVIYII